MRLLDSPASQSFRKAAELGGTKSPLARQAAVGTQVSVVSLDMVGEKSRHGEWGEGVIKDNSSK